MSWQGRARDRLALITHFESAVTPLFPNSSSRRLTLFVPSRWSWLSKSSPKQMVSSNQSANHLSVPETCAAYKQKETYNVSSIFIDPPPKYQMAHSDIKKQSWDHPEICQVVHQASELRTRLVSSVQPFPVSCPAITVNCDDVLDKRVKCRPQCSSFWHGRDTERSPDVE